MINKEFLRYLDFFGTKCSFYTEQKLKLYTPLGGILSIASILMAFLIFIYINISSFRREDPTIISSSTEEEDHRIKFNEEKIWLPWKISKYKDENFYNYSGKLYPIIKYYYKENNTELNYKNISFTLCNETSMKNMPNNYLIDSSLDQLYCIDMDDLLMGGSISSDFFYYVEFSLYMGEENIDELNSNNNITNKALNNKIINDQKSLQIIFYYPIFEFQEIDYQNPIKIRYQKKAILLCKNIFKINQLFLRKIILYDKLGLLDTSTKIYKYWVHSSINNDFYYIENKNNNKQYSKLYSLEILLDKNNICYYRSYKGILLILAHSLPLIKLVHNILKLTAKAFKSSSVNRKMTELLFENLTIKPNKYDNYVNEIRSKTNVKKYYSNTHNNLINTSTNDNNYRYLTNKNIINYKKKQNFTSYLLLKKKKNDNYNDNEKEQYRENSSVIIKPRDSPKLNNQISNTKENNPLKLRINSFRFNNLLAYKKLSLRYNEPIFQKKKKFVANKLFPFRYYFCAIFIKNIDISKHRFCMSRKFVKVYIFLSQLFDISSYCALQREFNIVKSSIFDEQNIKLIEQDSKINVNSQSFMREMNDCIGTHTFRILGKNTLKRRSIENNISKKFSIEKDYNLF